MFTTKKYSRQIGGFLLILALSFLLIPSGRASPTSSPQSHQDSAEKIQVVVSLQILGDFVDQIGGDAVKTTVLVSGTEDPHTYEPSPSEMTQLAEADLLFLMFRPGVEPWWEGYEDVAPQKDSILESNPDLMVIDTTQGIPPLTDKATGNPNGHVWTSPTNAKIMVDHIWTALKAQATTAAQNQTFEDNREIYQAELDQLVDLVASEKTNIQGTKVIVFHPSLIALYQDLGINRTKVIEEGGHEPSASHVAEIQQYMVDEGVDLITVQANEGVDTVIQLARDSNSKIILNMPLIPEVAPSGETIDTYIEMIEYNIEAVKNPLTLEEFEEYNAEKTGSDSSIPGFDLFYLFIGIGMGLAVLAIRRRR